MATYLSEETYVVDTTTREEILGVANGENEGKILNREMKTNISNPL